MASMLMIDHFVNYLGFIPTLHHKSNMHRIPFFPLYTCDVCMEPKLLTCVDLP